MRQRNAPRKARWLLAAALLGCAVPQAQQPQPVPQARPPNPEVCPATGDTLEGQCTVGAITCAYDGYECSCIPFPQCDESRPLPEGLDLSIWYCKRTGEGLRPDDCPWKEPVTGTPCTGQRECHYQSPCGPVARLCSGGRWHPPR
jgi:hypothetical protein